MRYDQKREGGSQKKLVIAYLDARTLWTIKKKRGCYKNVTVPISEVLEDALEQRA